MLFNGREMTAKKILVSPNDDAKGDRRWYGNKLEYKVIEVLLHSDLLGPFR